MIFSLRHDCNGFCLCRKRLDDFDASQDRAALDEPRPEAQTTLGATIMWGSPQMRQAQSEGQDDAQPSQRVSWAYLERQSQILSSLSARLKRPPSHQTITFNHQPWPSHSQCNVQHEEPFNWESFATVGSQSSPPQPHVT